ncbi:MAG: lysine-2,3-aminomutase-like protein [Alphaproteobacteria bacterium]|nr:lysine-2,3-aminomutase-like protein [Alphaproteobacteria bacterium]
MPAPAKTARSLDDLLAVGALPRAQAEDPALRAVAERYAIAVTPDVLASMRSRDPATDPVARQYIPTADEAVVAPEELSDPIGDHTFSPVKGVVHRYPDRVLLKTLHACPVYCRFCFRREQVGPGGEALDGVELTAALDYVRAHPEIWEVILTGGDPLMLAPRRLAEIVAALDAIEHVGVIRLHTRVPVADPSRVTPELVSALRAERAAVYVALHCNHANELTSDARIALRRLSDVGIPLLSQTVLLRGVNDDAATLEALFRALVQARVKPYYLHHPDLARGTGHFRLTIAEGQALMRALRGRVSGLCQPTYVLDIPGGHGKVPVGPCYVDLSQEGVAAVTDRTGGVHLYPPPAKESA